MKNITINADEIKIFGRAERYFLENSLEDFATTDLVLSGNFTDDCFEDLLNYLCSRHLKFHSITFSSELESIPHCTDYLPAENIIIPEGIRTIKKFSFLNSKIESLSLPSTLTQIEEKAFINCSIEKLELSESNNSFLLSDGALKNSLTKQIILKTKERELLDNSKWLKSQPAIWKKLSEKKCVSINAAIYWKDYYEKVKDSLRQKKLLVSVNTKSDAMIQLKMLLQVLPDSYGNLMKLPARNIEHHFFPYLLALQYLTEGKQDRFYPDQSTCFTSFFDPVSTVYCYTSTLLCPEPVSVLFNQINNGFELIIPKLQLFIFFCEDELTLIPAFILNLQKTLAEHLENIFKLKEVQIMENDFTQTDSKTSKITEQISQNSRQNVLSALNMNLSKNDQAIIDSNINKIQILTRKYNYGLTYEWNKQNELEVNLNKFHSPAKLAFTVKYSEIYKIDDSLLNLINQELKSMV